MSTAAPGLRRLRGRRSLDVPFLRFLPTRSPSSLSVCVAAWRLPRGGPATRGVSCCAALAAPTACLWVLSNPALGARPVHAAGWTARGLLGRGYLEVQLPSGVRPGGPSLRPSRQCPSARDPITPPGASGSPAERAGSFAAVSPTLRAAAGSPGVFASLRELEKGQGVPASRHVGSMCEKSLRSDLLTSSATRYCPLLENLRNS